MRETITLRLSKCSNRPAGFDYLRLILSSSVVLIHSLVSMGHPPGDAVGIGRPFIAMVLGMFFGLSGFLVAGSLERCRTMISFLGLRALRLVPALAVDTLISALILGPLFTTIALRTYFSSPMFYEYFLNIVGDIHFNLPGVFENHPTRFVNGQLWTLPTELRCYAVLTVLAIVGAVRYRYIFALVTILVGAISVYYDLNAPATFRTLLTVRVLLLCFLLGVTAYLFREKIVLSWLTFGLAAMAGVLLLYAQRADTLAAIPLIYVTIFLGMQTPRRLNIVSSGDYSYGIFLYGFPIQQAVYLVSGSNAWLNFLLAYPIILGLAVFSWFCVEKPALKLRPHLVALEAWMVRWSQTIPLSHWMLQPPVGPRLGRPPARDPL